METIGRFEIPELYLQNKKNRKIVKEIFKDVIVIEAKFNYLKKVFEYVGLNNKFKTIKSSEEIPKYDIEIKNNKINFIEWRN